MAFRILFVCTGNICRSPAAEALFHARIGARPIEVSSAGTSGLSGHDVDAPTAFALRELGLDVSTHVARRLSPAMVESADLVLSADSGHLSTIVQLRPLAFRHAFTMREFARLGATRGPLAGPVTPTALRDRVLVVAEQRGWAELADAGQDEIVDPFGGGIEVARATVHAVAGAVEGVLVALGLRLAAAQPELGDALGWARGN